MSILYSNNRLKYLKTINYPEIKIDQDQMTFLVGKSGSGKSTYLKLLNRTLLTKEGIIEFNGKNINDLDVLSYRKEVLLVPQELFLINGTIRDNFYFYYNARKEKHLNDEQIKAFLAICVANFSLDTDCRNLSGGERQRVFIAIFISLAKKVILLDEPTSALDEKTSFELLTNLKKYFHDHQITSLIVSHNDYLVKQFADRIIKIGE